MKKQFNLYLAGAIVFSIITLSIALLLYFYFSSPNVKTDGDKWGGPAEFGQFGDMIGGILNPIFGALTTFLLLITYHTTHRNSLRESRKSDREEIKLMIKEFSGLLDKRKNEKSFIDHSMYGPQSLQKLNTEGFEHHKKMLKDMLLVLTTLKDFDLDDPNYRSQRGNYVAMMNMRHNVAHITNLQMELIDKWESDAINSFVFLQLDDFLAEQERDALINQAEYAKYLVNAFEKYGKVPSGFTPRGGPNILSQYISGQTPTNQRVASITTVP